MSNALTIRAFKSEGPYYADTRSTVEADSLSSLIAAVRGFMEEGYELISAWFEDENPRCIGLWQDGSEPEPDGEGDWYWPKAIYRLRRPGGKRAAEFLRLAECCRGER